MFYNTNTDHLVIHHINGIFILWLGELGVELYRYVYLMIPYVAKPFDVASIFFVFNDTNIVTDHLVIIHHA